jgi:phosphoglycolate phosphatase
MKNFIKACKKQGFESIATKKDFLKLFENNMYESMFAMGMTRDQILKIVYFMRDALTENQDKINVFKGIYETLEKLSKENELVIVTSNETKVVNNFLKSRNLEFFNEIYGSDKEASKIEKIRKIKGKYPNSNYFYIGDTEGDIIEGRKAGVKTVAVSWGWHEKERLEKLKPDFIIYHPEEIEKILK